eukprot:TRINITY_DN44863_c0_g1_i1.p1 TRINITY_DN44863_c0_g1~~TRINITY_DN44863_c0_g1_i1.p1  ORF type:complete len:301 (+),score=40.27 TRINITY_DN44863_c0_g1_i1:90-992(+)
MARLIIGGHPLVDDSNHVLATKLKGFQDVANTLVVAFVEQLTQLHERELNAMFTEMRTELERVSGLLGSQLSREKQLHSMLQSMADHHAAIVVNAQEVARQQPDSKMLHELVDKLCGEQANIINSELSCVSQLRDVTSSNVDQAKHLHVARSSAEEEFARISGLLQVPFHSFTNSSTMSETPQSHQSVPGQLGQPGHLAVSVQPQMPSSAVSRKVLQPVVPRACSSTPPAPPRLIHTSSLTQLSNGAAGSFLLRSPPARMTGPASPVRRAASQTPIAVSPRVAPQTVVCTAGGIGRPVFG